MKECVEATMEKRLGKLITRKRSEGDTVGLVSDVPGHPPEDSQEGGGSKQSKQVMFGTASM